MVTKILEGIAQKLTKEMQKKGKVTSAEVENKDYYDKIKKLKENYLSDLKEKGILRKAPVEEYPHKIHY